MKIRNKPQHTMKSKQKPAKTNKIQIYQLKKTDIFVYFSHQNLIQKKEPSDFN